MKLDDLKITKRECMKKRVAIKRDYERSIQNFEMSIRSIEKQIIELDAEIKKLQKQNWQSKVSAHVKVKGEDDE